jgi:hypothetical protein
MNKVPEFLLCENEQKDLEGEYVLHTTTPRFLARLNYDDPNSNFVIVDAIDPIEAAAKKFWMEKMEQWYDAYQTYLDEVYGGEED